MKLFIYCAGGFGKETADLARRVNNIDNGWEEICFIDDDCRNEVEFYGGKLFTFDTLLKNFDMRSCEILIASGEPLDRKNIYDKVRIADFKLATLIDKSAIISSTAKLGQGVIVSPHCFISSSAIIGDNTSLNTDSLIGHDATIAENCVISSAVNIGGNCTIGERTYVGMGSQIKQGTKIGRDVIVGMGSIVHNHIEDEMVVLGNPARPIRRNEDKVVFK